MDESDFPHGITAEEVREMKQKIARCWIVAGLLIDLPLEELDRMSARAETLGPVMYPGIWRANAKAIMEDREMIHTLVAAQRDVLTTAPSFQTLASIIRPQVEAYSKVLEAVFREIFSRREVSAAPPVVILSALVQFIARLAPNVKRV